MKISKETIAILQNFATISNNLRIYPGNVLATLSPQTSIFAKATVADTFPVDACIYNLGSLLELFSYMGDQEVEFGEKALTIKSNGYSFEYRYADPTVIIAPPAGKTIELDSHYQFTLSAEDIKMITKAAGITAAENIIFEAKDGQFSIHVADKAGSMKQSRVMGAADVNFTAVLSTQNLRVLPDTYTVTVSKMKFLHFKPSTAQTPEYWLALDPKSVI